MPVIILPGPGCIGTCIQPLIYMSVLILLVIVRNTDRNGRVTRQRMNVATAFGSYSTDCRDATSGVRPALQL